MFKKFVPALLVALASFAGTAHAGNFWFDFDHDGSLSTIQPRTSRTLDTLSVVVDLSGVSLSAPFTLSWVAKQNQFCFPNQTIGAVAGIDTLPGSRTADADSAWYDDVSSMFEAPWTQFNIRFFQIPALTAHVVLKLVLTYPGGEFTPCTTAGVVDFSAATIDGVGPVGSPHQVKIKDLDVPVQAATWGRLRRTYR